MNDNPTTIKQKKETLLYWIPKILESIKSRGFQIEPIPKIILDESENDPDDLFIKTGYYDPNDESLVLFINNRHIKDILRTFCHEMVHRYQHLTNPQEFEDSVSGLPLEQDSKLQEIEGEAYLYGNLLFREFTEEYTHH